MLSPLLFWGGQALASHGIATFLQRVDFHSFFDRAVLVAAVVLLWPLTRSLKIASVSDLGLRKNPKAGRDLWFGLAVAVGSSAILLAWALAVHAWRLPPSSRWSQVPMILLTAAVVSALEESLFRGAMQGVVQRSTSKAVAMIFVAALFAVVHFLRQPENIHIAPESVGWGSGFALVPQVCWQFKNPTTLLGGLTTLFILALILGYTRLKTASLWLPCGLHAGWVIGAKVGTMSWVKIGKRGITTLPWFGADLITGLSPVLVLAVTGAFLVWWVGRGPKPQA